MSVILGVVQWRAERISSLENQYSSWDADACAKNWEAW